MRLIYITLLLFLCVNVFGQKNFRPGFIISNESDTTEGFIDYRGDTKSMKVCTFKKSEDAKPVDYSPGDIKAYRFTDDGKFFISKYINTDNLQDTVFVEYLLKGITDLYFYQKPLSGFYFLEDENGELLELSNEDVRVERNGHVYMVDNNRYIGLLNYAFADCPEVLSKVKTTKLNHHSLIDITKKYHEYECDDEECIIYEKKTPGIRVEFVPSLGYSLTGLELLEPIWEGTDFEQFSGPELSFGFDILFPRLNDKLSLFTSIILRKQDFHGVDDKDAPFYLHHFYLNSTNATLGLSLKYTYPKGKVVPVIFVGGMASVEIDSEVSKALFTGEGSNGSQKLSEESIPDFFNDLQPGYWGGVGFEIPWNNIKLFSNLTFSQGFNSKEGFYRFKRSSAALSVGCIF
jgi:hypothetical protein